MSDDYEPSDWEPPPAHHAWIVGAFTALIVLIVCGAVLLMGLR